MAFRVKISARALTDLEEISRSTNAERSAHIFNVTPRQVFIESIWTASGAASHPRCPDDRLPEWVKLPGSLN
jgi:hypothetical protein